MKTKIAVLGSCISRDVFNSYFVPDYKNFFEIKFDGQRTSIISLMQNPLEFDKKLIDILPHNPKNNARTKFITQDLNKIFLKKLIEDNIDYLIIDNYFEFLYGILYFDNNIITGNGWDLPETELYKKLSDKLILRISENYEEYFCIWSKYCDLFFKFLRLYCPNVKVILNQARETNQVIKSDGTCYINPDFTKTMNIANPLLEKLDSYIIDNFEVSVLKFDYENTYCEENHIWGFAPIHYHKNYHKTIFNKLRTIISEEDFIPDICNHNHLDKNSFKKELNRTNSETKLLLDNIKKQRISENLKIYNTCRVDIKNFGISDNKIKIIESNIPISENNFPGWFKTNTGEGLSIQNNESPIDLKIKCINDGILKIYLRGPDIHDKNGNRFPVYIDLTKLMINNKLIFDDNKLVWHDEAYIFEKKVTNSEVISIHVEYLPFTSQSIYNK